VPALCSLEQSTNKELEKKAILSPSLLLSSLISTFQKSLRTTISKFIDHPPLDPSVDPNQVFAGNFAPVDELEPTNCEVVEGELPGYLNGVLS
jgi:9-cis-epoxycarotenoid dioxygenase